MEDNKMLSLILNKIEKAITQSVEEYTWDKKSYTKQYFYARQSNIELMCELITVGINDEYLEYAIKNLKRIRQVLDTLLENLAQSTSYSYPEEYYINYNLTLMITVNALEQRQESINLLQEGYSGKCIL